MAHTFIIGLNAILFFTSLPMAAAEISYEINQLNDGTNERPPSKNVLLSRPCFTPS